MSPHNHRFSSVPEQATVASGSGQGPGPAGSRPLASPPPSVLFHNVGAPSTAEALGAPPFFRDLNLDQVVTGVTSGFWEYHLEPFFNARPHADSVTYRQEVMQELEAEPAMAAVRTFAQRMRMVRERVELAVKRYYKEQKERTFLGAVETYCGAARGLSNDLDRLELRSRGMRAFREYLRRYVGSASFNSLVAEIETLKSDLAGIRYSLLLRGGDIEVRPFENAEDYSAVIERTFARFRRGAVKDYRAEPRKYSDMNHIEAAILDRVAKLNPEVFQRLEAFCANHSEFVDGGLSRFDREVHFYVAYLAFIGRLRDSGLPFCYPTLSRSSKEIACRDTFDLALAARQVGESAPVVTNDFHLRGRERIFVVTGPNQGGKTTFARTFGQLHYLASLGCAVPGSEARLFHFDWIFTHFEREEVAANLRGKLRDDLIRIREILEQAGPTSIVIMNEIFASTTVKDAVFLGTEIMKRLCRLDVLAVCVTFLSELATLDQRVVSMTSTVDPADPAIRTFKVVRSPATGLAYALAIARKHRVTFEQILERLEP